MNVKQSNPKDIIGSGKLPMHCVPDSVIAESSLAWYEGMLKYGFTNWAVAGVRASIYRAALQRHLAKWWAGQDRDPETGVHHLGSVIACAGIIIDAEMRGKLTDDRPPMSGTPELIDSLSDRVAHLQKLFGDRNPRHWVISDSDLTDADVAQSQPPDLVLDPLTIKTPAVSLRPLEPSDLTARCPGESLYLPPEDDDE